MKKITLLLLLLAGNASLYAQEHVPLLNEDLVWSVMDEKFQLVGDTIINDNHYKKLYFHKGLSDFTPDALLYLAAIREDVTEKRVWLLWKDHQEEILLYDLSLEIGEEFIVKSPYYSLEGPVYFHDPAQERVMVITDKSTQVINDIERTVLELNSPYETYGGTEYWIEGIGSDRGVIYAGIMAELEMDGAYPYLLCVHENDSLIYQSEDPWGYGSDEPCYSYPATSVPDFTSNRAINVFPTHFDNHITVQIEEPLEFIEIYDGFSRLVDRTVIPEKQFEFTIHTSDWPNGIYILRAWGKGRSYSTKVIKQ